LAKRLEVTKRTIYTNTQVYTYGTAPQM